LASTCFGCSGSAGVWGFNCATAAGAAGFVAAGFVVAVFGAAGLLLWASFGPWFCLVEGDWIAGVELGCAGEVADGFLADWHPSPANKSIKQLLIREPERLIFISIYDLRAYWISRFRRDTKSYYPDF
jgi:hypothetical protein